MTTAPTAELEQGELVLHGRIMPASNATFLGQIGEVRVVYKPISGERPLWDFPIGTLADRQEPDPEQEAVTLVEEGSMPPGWKHVFDGIDGRDLPVSLVHEDSEPLRRMAVFDVLVNNADRKGGHVLEMSDGHRYGVDHGVTFHVEHKLRTVLWGWLGDPVPEDDLAEVLRVGKDLSGLLGDQLSAHLTDPEIDAMGRRCRRLSERAVMPAPHGSYPAIPWPPF
jgi:uncharacterized repeat protein (TIGR03843 family)